MMRSLNFNLVCVACALLSVGCDRGPAPSPAQAPTVVSTPKLEAAPQGATKPSTIDASTLPPVRWRLESAPPRLVAIGDIHGDIKALEVALKASGLIDDRRQWVGAQTLLVQTGDVLDRGDDEQEILDWLDALTKQARRDGGDVLQLLGNHETMNAMGDLRYVTPGGFKDFEDVPGLEEAARAHQELPAIARHRMAAFEPGGPYALRLSHFPVVAQVGKTLFVHGGVTREHVDEGLVKINTQTSMWLRALGPMPAIVADDQGPLWLRVFSSQDDPVTCARLDEALKAANATRMVVGHTVQRQGITSACEGKVWRIDVGMAAHYGGSPQALELRGEQVRIIDAREAQNTQAKP